MNNTNKPENQAQGNQVLAQDSTKTVKTEQSHAGTALLPPVDIFEDEAGITLVADLPGVTKDQLRIEVTGDNLVIEGNAKMPEMGSIELLYGELMNPQYRRGFTLSRELDPGKIEAKLDHGVLKLRIPKSEQAKPRRIEVNGA